jgi:hypothetical protein
MQSIFWRAAAPRALSLGARRAGQPFRYVPSLSFTRTLVSTCNCGLYVNYHANALVIAKKYTKDHEMVSFDDATGVGMIHITNYAQSSLGDVVFVELPAVGASVKKGGLSGSQLLHSVIETSLQRLLVLLKVSRLPRTSYAMSNYRYPLTLTTMFSLHQSLERLRRSMRRWSPSPAC